jgi:hypothetical protein
MRRLFLYNMHAHCVVNFVVSFAAFGILLGFTDVIIIPSIILGIFSSVVSCITSWPFSVTKPIAFCDQFGNDIEIYLARAGFIPLRKDGPVIYYERRPPMRLFTSPVLIVRKDNSVEIEGPWPIIKGMARAIPGLLPDDRILADRK